MFFSVKTYVHPIHSNIIFPLVMNHLPPLKSSLHNLIQKPFNAPVTTRYQQNLRFENRLWKRTMHIVKIRRKSKNWHWTKIAKSGDFRWPCQMCVKIRGRAKPPGILTSTFLSLVYGRVLYKKGANRQCLLDIMFAVFWPRELNLNGIFNREGFFLDSWKTYSSLH